MSAVLPAPVLGPAGERAEGVWHAAWRRYRADRVGVVSLGVVLVFLVLITASALGLVARNWQDEVGVANAPPTFIGPAPAEATGTIDVPTGPNVDLSDIDPLAPRYKEWDERAAKLKTTESTKRETLPLGGDRFGRDVLSKAVKGTQISVFVGVLAAVVATTIGTLLGILLFLAFAAVLGRGIGTVVVILGLTGWTGMYRQVRAEFIKHSTREYVRAAEAVGASPLSRMFRHILPNISHVMLVRLGLLVVGFIKAEVILSYLGLGVPVDAVSWGTMLAEAQAELILGHWWQLATATLFMAVFVTAFSLMADAARDALDPKLRGLE